MASSPFVAKVRGRQRPVVTHRRPTMSITTTAPAKPTTNQPTVDQENVSATLTVAAPATRVFAVLADPATHAAIDGTGWVQESADRAPLTEAGQIFRMDMH